MKFMKLGSKPDQFQTEGDNIRYVATELATDVVINVGDVKFYLHKFPLLSKSARLQKLVSCINEDNSDEVVDIDDIPGGPAAFEICAKFCYGMIVTLNAYNVIAARCAAEYLEMHETVDKRNLIYKIEVFLSSSIFRSWKDSIIVLQTTRSLLPWSEELKMVSRSLDSIALKASIDPSMVEWSYTYNRKKLPSENGNNPHYNGVKKHQFVPKDWWVEDLCELHIDLYKRVVTTIKSKDRVSADVVGDALQAYTLKRLPSSSNSMIQSGDLAKYRYLVDSITWLLPPEKNSVPCSFLLRLLKASIALESGETARKELLRRVGRQLDEAAVTDLLIKAPSGEATIYNIDIVRDLVDQFIMQERNPKMECHDEFREICPEFVSDVSKAKVARLIDMYLAEAARDPNLPLSKFMELADMTSGFSRQSHDGIYRAIDMYLKQEHPGITKSERKRLCRYMDCRKLSAEACSHAVQNERLPLRVVVQVLFFEQMRATVTGGNSTPDLPGSIRTMLPGGSHGSSRSATTHTDEDLDAVPTTEELKALKVELATLRLRNIANESVASDTDINVDKVAANKVKGAALSKLFSKLWSNKDKHSENSSSETSESAASTSADDAKSTPSRSRRHSSS